MEEIVDKLRTHNIWVMSRTTHKKGFYLFLTEMPPTDKCPKCGKMAWKPDQVERVGKDPEKVYTYLRYRHPLDGRTKRNKTCYVRVKE